MTMRKLLVESVRSLPTAALMIVGAALMYRGVRWCNDAQVTNGLLAGILAVLWEIARAMKESK